LSFAKSSASDRKSGTLSFSAISGAFGPGSTIAESSVEGQFRISSIWRSPINPAPATAIRTLRMTNLRMRFVAPRRLGRALAGAIT
jgi:hypothetical protein